MAETISGGNSGVALLANTMATVFSLYVLIETLGPVSGAHFNPVVSLFFYLQKKLSLKEFVFYTLMQIVGAMLGAFVANYLFGLDVFQLSEKPRAGTQFLISEMLATSGLLGVILLSSSQKAASLVASYIGAAYWFCSSTSFANPAAVFGRMLTNSFSGIRPGDAVYFIAAQFLGGYLVHLTALALKKSKKSF